MRKILFFPLLLLTLSLSAQTKALTVYGDEVMLFDDGTWLFVNDSLNQFADEEVTLNLSTNPNKFTKPKDAKFELRSKVMDVAFWFDTRVWKSTKFSFNEDAEYQFESKDKDIYGIVITERIEIPVETLRTISVQNITEVAKSVEIIEEEYREVNGKTVISTRLNVLVEGIKLTYHIYYYSDESGSMQFMTYTSRNLYESSKIEMENLLNGFVASRK
ncbi:MAG TPA: hypothetical protein VIK71_07180 [Flavobacteriales bacterium]